MGRKPNKFVEFCLASLPLFFASACSNYRGASAAADDAALYEVDLNKAYDQLVAAREGTSLAVFRASSLHDYLHSISDTATDDALSINGTKVSGLHSLLQTHASFLDAVATTFPTFGDLIDGSGAAFTLNVTPAAFQQLIAVVTQSKEDLALLPVEDIVNSAFKETAGTQIKGVPSDTLTESILKTPDGKPYLVNGEPVRLTFKEYWASTLLTKNNEKLMALLKSGNVSFEAVQAAFLKRVVEAALKG